MPLLGDVMLLSGDVMPLFDKAYSFRRGAQSMQSFFEENLLQQN